MDFVRNNVLFHESNYVFHAIKHIQHFELYTNCPHEGTMSSMKYSSTPCLPFHTLLESHEIQNFQDKKK